METSKPLTEILGSLIDAIIFAQFSRTIRAGLHGESFGAGQEMVPRTGGGRR